MWRLNKMNIKILCINRSVCEDVIKKLDDLDFKHIVEVNAPSFDISAKFSESNEDKIEKVVDDLFKTCTGKIQTIQIS